ncbi:hypothetical protein A1O1_00600 [Capronia coronata CBS 617.96]|uniref:Methyltransferase type 11 domain-containing protein n=1 Tax=Capronia coronata CBS 617.96 TaxID=1182541 RepID=W9YSH0_9EURO|nr:uncharacterized protein A1O1_00600 [Capronia coronata CBS 617.96]EXJ95478.1 hypothetical protein A1O1_00600 [Capronia coronata CBS 617.96]
MQTHDIQEGFPVTRNATVPRNIKSPTVTQNAPIPAPTRPNAARASASQSPSLRTVAPGLSSGKLRQRPPGIPQIPAKAFKTQVTTVSTDVSATRISNSSSEIAGPLLQEVPLMLDPGIRSRMHDRQSSGRRAVRPSNTSSDGRKPPSPVDMVPDAIFGIVTPRLNAPSRPADLPSRLIPELQALAATSSRRPEAFNKSTSSMSSPSTRFSPSPSPWSISTTTTTPTSWSSASPGLVQPLPAKDSRSREAPTAPRGKPLKTPAALEGFVQPSESDRSSNWKELRRSPSSKRNPLKSPAPAPPPRTSSTKQGLSRSSSRSSKQRKGLENEPVPQLPSEMEQSPLSKHTQTTLEHVGESLLQAPLARAYDNLQQSLSGALPRYGLQGMRPTANPVLVARREHISTSKVQQILPSRSARGRVSEEAALTIPEGPRDSHRDKTSQTSPSRSGKLSRLGIFSHSSKSTAPGSEVGPRKLQRKGPAAGTGHEGYGKPGRRGRETSRESGSVSNSESERSVSSSRKLPFFSSKSKNSRNGSRQNPSSQSDLDDFAATRLRPVPMVGGSGASINARPGGGTEVYESTLSLSSSAPKRRTMSSQSSFSQNSLQESLGDFWNPASIANDVPTLAIRRSQRFGHERESLSLPTSIRTHEPLTPLHVSSEEESRSSAPLASLSTPSTTTEPRRGDPPFQDSQNKRNWKTRWNIFRRKGAKQEPEQTAPRPSSPGDELPVRVSSVSAPRPTMPYYAMIDSESETNTTDQLPSLMPQLTESPKISPVSESYVANPLSHQQMPDAYGDNILLPQAPLPQPHSFDESLPSVPLRSPTQQAYAQTEEQSNRQPRLPRVGRIPAVVQRSEGQYRPNRASFSQPFSRESGAEDAYNGRELSTAGFSGQLQATTYPPRGPPSPAVGRVAPTTGYPLTKLESLRFPSEPASNLFSSSASDGFSSIPGPLLEPGRSEREISGRSVRYNSNTHMLNSPSVDEVWNEYDDFIDHVMSPSLSKSHRDSTGREETPLHEQAGVPLPRLASEGSILSSGDLKPSFPDMSMSTTDWLSSRQGAATSESSPPFILTPSAGRDQTVGEEVRLRRSRIVSALHSSADLPSPFSIRDLLKEYDSYQRNSAKSSQRLSTLSVGQSPDPFEVALGQQLAQETPNHEENVALLDGVERNKDPVAQSELHFASLMVAKWLSFGRVLFSPAHDEIQTLRERHILVIDGLGNEDWSIYCAVTYEAPQAIVHHLKEKSSTTVSKSHLPPQNTPETHRRAQVASFYDRFPFPPALFSAVVLRFPPAMAEAKMKNIISECRRVLLPGGHLELLLLDLDIVNMGVQTRRAVRELKFRMTTADKQISLRPIIDNVQGLLGASGFSNVSRCIVGVPVAGRPAGSTDSSSSSRSSGGSDSFQRHTSGSPRPATASPRMTFRHGRKGANLSLNDLIADHSHNADAKIGKIVSRTARAWWQHCFEASVIPDGNLSRSIFADKGVLRECRNRGSSFKMLIAHAQRPVFEARRRTVSEPIVPTLATAGVPRRTQQLSSS